MTRLTPTTLRNRLLVGASVTALVVWSSAASAQDMFAKTPRNPATQAAQAAANRATRNQAAATATQRTIQAFTRASQIRQRMDAAQAAARAAAQAAQANIPDGLGAGGLKVANGVSTDPSLWVGADGPTQSQGSDGRTTVEIGQTQAKAILTWDSFNVGRKTDLNFNQQGNTDWVALNRVTDVSADPSKILGSIRADGTVLVLNRNGVIFGGASQVNARNIVAAAATMTNDQFVARGIYSAQEFGALSPSFIDAGGKVAVEAGATLTTAEPKTVTQGGGYVLLLGTSVENAGQIITPEGQALLAAGDDFLVRPGVGSEANQYSTTRGNEVRGVIDFGSLAGAVANTGSITAVQGDITLTGRNVVQAGVAVSTTSVSQRGTIHLLTSASDAEGSVVLTENSLTTILPELDSDETALNVQRDGLVEQSSELDLDRFGAAQAGLDNLNQFDNLSRQTDRRDQSRVEIVSGGDVTFETGSMTIAQGGQVAVTAIDRISAENGTLIDVSGVRDVMLDMSSNTILVNVQGNELRDSPANRELTGLKNQDVWIDVRDLVLLPDGTGGYEGDRYYTPGGLLEVSGALNNQAHGIGEWAAIGGTITLQAAEVMADEGGVFDISGGSLSYRGGSTLRTRLLGSDGRRVDIGQASALLPYSGVGDAHVVTHERWGPAFTEVYSNPLFNRAVYARREDAYVVGRDAGKLIISAPTTVFEADVFADVVIGDRQTRARPEGITDGYKLSQDDAAQAGVLAFGRLNGLGFAGADDSRFVIGDIDDITGEGGAPLDVLPEDRAGATLLDADRVNGFGLGGLQITTANQISIDKGLTLADGGALALNASAIQINADVVARSGSITVSNVAPPEQINSAPVVLTTENAAFTLGEGATLDLSGVWTNGRLDRADAPSTAHVDGGDLTVRMVQGSVTLEAGSLVDVSSGATLLRAGEVVGGRGGDVTLIAGVSPVEGSPVSNPTGVRLTLDGEIRAQGVVGGGTLTLQSPVTTVFGEDALLSSGVVPAGETTPTGVILAEDVLIPAGGVVPIARTESFTSTIPDVPALQDLQPSNQAPIVTAADWIIPEGVALFDADFNFLQAGEFLPAGSTITFFSGLIPAGTVTPTAVFPDGIPVNPYGLNLQAGDVTPVALTYVAGLRVSPGAVFAEDVVFEAALTLDPSLLSSGFSDYSITSLAGLRVTAGVELKPEVPVLRLTEAGLDVATGADPLEALETWTPPVYLEDRANGVLSQREGAGLTLRGADLAVASGARIEVDPEQSVRLTAAGQLTIEGSITAAGGDIALLNESVGTALDLVESTKPGTSIWIGEEAVLDVAGRAHIAEDARVRRYGVVQDGGSIRIGIEDYTRTDRDFLGATAANVVIREGAVLDASGAAGVIDLRDDLGLGDRPTSVTLAGDGGLIRLGSRRSVFNDGAMRAAAGGEGAAGGVLNLVLDNTTQSASGVRVMTVTQNRTSSNLPGDLAAGEDDPTLAIGQARLSVEEIEAGGFGTLDLWSRDVFSFEGDVSLNMDQGLILRRGVLSAAAATPEANVFLSAPYVLLDGKVEITLRQGEALPGLGRFSTYGGLSSSTLNAASLSIKADLIDVYNQNFFGGSGEIVRLISDFESETTPLDFAGFATTDIFSQGDIRFTDGLLAAGGDMTLTAAQLYPTTNATGEIRLGRTIGELGRLLFGDNLLTIRGHGGPAPAMPLSAFGRMTLTATTIDQGGIVRAPFGKILFGLSPAIGPFVRIGQDQIFNVNLLAGGITSTSGAGLLMPYGGTSDDLEYLHDGEEVSFVDLADLSSGSGFVTDIETGVVMGLVKLTAEEGSLIDVSGGGELTGAGFFTGRGGSVDVLRTPLANANPAYRTSSSDAEVYALVPSQPGGYAPVTPDDGAGSPMIGRQITFDEPVGDLPAGTYTLMPSTYALMPGAYRIELGEQNRVDVGQPGLPDGSFQANGYLGVANTAVRDVLPTLVTLTAADQVRTFSQYNETSYAEFGVANAAAFGALRPRLERDAQSIHLDFGVGLGEVLDFNGVADMAAAEGGVSGNLFLTSLNNLEIKAAEASATDGFAAVNADEVSAFEAGSLTVGGLYSLVDALAAPELGSEALGPRVVFSSNFTDTVVRSGAELTAGQIFLTGRDVRVEDGAVLDTTAGPTDGLTSTAGYVFSDTYNNRNAGGAILTVANGFIDFTPPTLDPEVGPASITIEDGAALRTLGTINLTGSGAVTLGDAELNARFLALTVPSIDIGTAESFAAAEAAGVLGAGVRLTDAVLDRLLNPTSAQTSVERISLTVGESINLFGDVDLTLQSGDAGAALVLNTPALYGWGEAGDLASISVDTLIWNGVSTGTGDPASPFGSLAPGAVTPGAAGTGEGRLVIDARRIEFGYDPLARSQDQAELDRLVLGFASVDLNASERITANNRGTLSVYQTGVDAASYAGGSLNLTTPLLTGEAGSFMAYRAGGALTVAAPDGAAPVDPAGIDALGAEVRLAGQTVNLNTTVALPSGRLVIEAGDDIALGDRADIDLSGRALTFFDVTKHSWGGDLILESADGAITQAAGSAIDVSAEEEDAGAIKATATGAAGRVDLAGTLLGAGGEGFDSGAIDLRARVLDDFTGLNIKLNDGGFFEARSFVVKTGDLNIGDEVRAQRVSISVDGGSLTVNGLIDASGDQVGTIRLAARDDLTLGAGAVLDAHGEVLAVDAYGEAIEASNRAEIELTSIAGAVTFAPGATLDLSSADNIARGRLEINAPRIGGDDVAVNASGGVAIRGADSIAVNAFASYAPADGVINQGYLDGIHADSTVFIDAAVANGAVDARLAGLTSYGDAFHFRPGVEIRGDGDLTVESDLDLSGYRYGPDADGAIRGSGEPGVLTIRAGGDLIVNGSINDGFLPPPATPDDDRWIGEQVSITLVGGEAAPSNITFEAFDPDLGGAFLVFPSYFTGADYPVVVSGSVSDDFSVYGPGDTIFGILYGTITLAEGTVLSTADPANATIAVDFSLPREGVSSWALSDMLPPGASSWSMRLIGGADLASADSRTLGALSALDGRGDVILDSPGEAGSIQGGLNLSVIRTGTGSLDVLAGGDYLQRSLYGVYTAGTQIEESGPWNLARGAAFDGTVLADPALEATLNAQRMYFTEGGGDLMLAAQGDVRGFHLSNANTSASTSDIGNWLWRQGGEDLGQLTAWGVNFGQYRLEGLNFATELVGFSGIGALGGGDVTVIAGGDAGSTSNLDPDLFIERETTALDIVIGGSGRVTAAGDLLQTGGGTLTLQVGGRLNTGVGAFSAPPTSGTVVNLRGDVAVSAGAIGQTLEGGYGLRAGGDPRAEDTREALGREGFGGLSLIVGDGAARIETRGDLVAYTGLDAGRVPSRGGETAASDGLNSGAAVSSFSLWTDRSALDLFAAGGDVIQRNAFGNAFNVNDIFYDPGQLTAVAAAGSIQLENLFLAPSERGNLQLLARDQIVQDSDNLFGGAVAVSSGAPGDTATPLNPLWILYTDPFTAVATNSFNPNRFVYEPNLQGANLFAFGRDGATDLHAGTTDPIRIYAVNGDITGRFGRITEPEFNAPQLFYIAAKPTRMLTGRDILIDALFLNNDPDDISVIRAGRDILNSDITIAGPGLLEVTAGRNIYQALPTAPFGNDSTIDSIGPVVLGDNRPGAGVALIAGVGVEGLDYGAFASLYLDAANLADPERPLADQPGKVVKTYDKELVTWLVDRFGYDGTEEEALAYFQSLPEEQQAVLVRDIYYEELRQGGREYNDPDSRRFNSYLRGRNTIATLFPDKTAEGETITYDGDITYIAAAGTHTDFGGDIQVLTPGGGLTLGATGVAPPPTTGLLTQGSGDIEVYTKDSVLLGLSRIFTTFGGGITIWSAEGDINAGRGAKGTVVFAPVKRVYDAFGNVTLSPTVPTSGAGIGTLNPIPEVPAGDIDLIAPLGTIDAGEAGIRVSGNVNLAALQIVNAANIDVQGDATGIPVAAAVNTGALTSASAATSAVVNEAARLAERARPDPIRDIPTILTVRFVGFGEE